ncbi:MAG: hypothetical protein FWH34_05685 [Desulfovibrionaceae bacterium]|nr:hypothetical protein [Desulfovibrionaceae bacterium]
MKTTLLFSILVGSLLFSTTVCLAATVGGDGTVRSSSGNSIGKIENDGAVRDAGGNRIGKIENDGTVRNAAGNNIGKGQSGMKKEWAGALFFFFK